MTLLLLRSSYPASPSWARTSQWEVEPGPVKPEGWRGIWLFTTESLRTFMKRLWRKPDSETGQNWNLQILSYSGWPKYVIHPSLMFVSNLDFKETSKEFLTALPTLAQDIMAIPATSVPSERLFSISGILSENRRSRISPENLENRVLIKANKIQ